MYLIHIMKRIFLPLLLIFIGFSMSFCKKERPSKPPVEPPVTPPVTPPGGDTPVLTGLVTTNKLFPSADESFTLTFDPTKGDGGLSGFTGDVYIHTGVITNLSNNSPSNWRYVKSDWTTNNPAAKMTRQSNGKYTIDINPRSYYGVPSGESILKLALVFRNADGSLSGKNKDGSDIFLQIFPSNTLNVRFTEPEMEPLFDPKPVLNNNNAGQEINVTAYASQATNLTLSR